MAKMIIKLLLYLTAYLLVLGCLGLLVGGLVNLWLLHKPFLTGAVETLWVTSIGIGGQLFATWLLPKLRPEKPKKSL